MGKRREGSDEAGLRCPSCEAVLQRRACHDVEVDVCGKCGGMWVVVAGILGMALGGLEGAVSPGWLGGFVVGLPVALVLRRVGPFARRLAEIG